LKQKKLPLNIEEYKPFRFILLVLLCIFIFYPPFLRGLYFEENQIPAEIFVFIIFIAFWVYRIFTGDKKLFVTPIDYAAFLLTAIYFLSVILYFVGIRIAVAPKSAVLEWLKYCMYFSVFYMLSDLIKTFKHKLAILWTIVGTTVCLCIIGFDGAAGQNLSRFINSVFELFKSDNSIFGTFVTQRIYSTLQYPNALASYLIAVFLVTLTLTMISKNTVAKLIAAACSYVFLITFVFTQSRGMILVAPVVAILYIIALPKGSRINGFVHGLSSLISTGIICVFLYKYMLNNQGNESKIWLLFFAGIVLSVIVSFAVKFAVPFLQKISWKIYATAGGVLVVGGIVALIVSLNATENLQISYPEGQSAPSTFMKGVMVKPGKDYKLVYDVDAEIKGDKPSAYTIIINYKREKDLIVNEREVPLATIDGLATKGVETRDVAFKLPADSKVVNIYFRNNYSGTKAVFDKVKVVDSATGKVAENVKLNYKYSLGKIGEKIQSTLLSRSYIERSIFYRDGLKMFKDRWLIGGGGGTWEFLSYYYQSFYYTSTQAHNYLLQIATDCGVVGILIFLFLIVSIVATFILEYRKKEEASEERILQAALFAAVMGMIMHSVLDFDFSLSAVFLLFWQLLGIFNSRYRNYTEESEAVEQGLLLKMAVKLNGIKKLNVYPALMLCFVIVVLIVPICISSAKGSATTAMRLGSTDFNKALEAMKSATSSDPYAAKYKIDYIDNTLKKGNITSEELESVKKQIAKLEKVSWYDSQNIAVAGSEYIKIGEIDKGLTLFDRATELKPFRVEDWQQKIGAYNSVISYYLKNNKRDTAKGYIDKALNIENEIINANKRNMNPFIMNSATLQVFENIKYFTDNMKTIKDTDFGRTAFYNIPMLDVDKNNQPDQWIVNNSNTQISINGNGMIVDVLNGAQDASIQSRYIGFEAKKKYRIEVELNNKISSGSIPFNISGLMQNNEELIGTGNIYSREFSIPEGFKPADNFLKLFAKEKLDIKSIRIYEI